MKRIILFGIFLLLLPLVNASYTLKQNMTVANNSINPPTYRIFNVTIPGENCSDMTFYNASQAEILPYMIDANTTANTCAAWIRTDNLQNWRYNESLDQKDNSNTCSLYSYDASMYYDFEGNPSAPLYNSKCGIGNSTENKNSWITPNGKFQYAYIGFGNVTTNAGLKFPFPGTFNNQNFTIMGWFYQNDTTSEATLGYTSSNCEYSINFNQAGAGKPRWFIYNHAAVFDNLGSPMSNAILTGAWVHFAFVTSNGTSGAGMLGQIYENGTNVQNLTSATVTMCMDASNNFYIGSGGSGGLPTFKGLWDRVRVYNRALSQAEIQADYFGNTVTFGTPMSTVPNTAPNITLTVMPGTYCDFQSYNYSVFVWDNETNNATVNISVYQNSILKESYFYGGVINNSQWQINSSLNWTAYQNFYLSAKANDSLSSSLSINQTINHCVPAAAPETNWTFYIVIFVIIIVMIITMFWLLTV